MCVWDVSTVMDMWRWENILEISFLPSCMRVPGIKLVIRFGSECFYPLSQLFPFSLSRMFLIYLLAFWECSKLFLHPRVSHSVPNSTDLTAYLSLWSTVSKDSHVSADDGQLDQLGWILAYLSLRRVSQFCTQNCLKSFFSVCHEHGVMLNLFIYFFSYFSVFTAAESECCNCVYEGSYCSGSSLQSLVLLLLLGRRTNIICLWVRLNGISFKKKNRCFLKESICIYYIFLSSHVKVCVIYCSISYSVFPINLFWR